MINISTIEQESLKTDVPDLELADDVVVVSDDISDTTDTEDKMMAEEFKELKEDENTPEEIDNDSLGELDSLILEIDSDAILNDDLDF